MGAGLDRSARISHRAALASIAGCAVLSGVQPEAPGSDAPPDPTTTTVAVALGVAAIAARRASTSSVPAAGTRLALVLAGHAFAFALAALGSFVALHRGQPQVGLMFSLAAGILSLRPPPRLDAPAPST